MQTSEQVFSNVIQQATNITHSDNGDVAYRSTLSSCLDLYGSMGALRGRTEEFLRYFKSAVKENPETAIALLLKLRDIKNGLGERELFKTALKWLVNESGIKFNLVKLFGFIADKGRYDDLMIDANDWYLNLLSFWYMTRIAILSIRSNDDSNPNKKDAEKHLRLMFRWIKRNPKEKHLKRFNHLLRKTCKLNHKEFRNLIKLANSPEQLMSSKQWSEIVYEHLPSRTMLKFRKAFKRNDEARFDAYLESLTKGEKKVNAGTLYPYDIYNFQNFKHSDSVDQVLLNKQWESLPNYFEGMDKVPTILPVLDISASMLDTVSGKTTAMDISQSLGVYLTQRNPGLLNNVCMIFAEDSYFIKLPESTLDEIHEFINNQNVGYSTNYNKMYENVLETSLKLKQTANDANTEFIPIDVLLVISDMNFNQSQSYGSLRNKRIVFDKHAHRRLKNAFDKEGIPMPKLVFWNVNHNGTFTCTVEDNNVCQLSGFSPSSIRDVLPIIDKINPVLVMENGIKNYLPIAKEILSK